MFEIFNFFKNIFIYIINFIFDIFYFLFYIIKILLKIIFIVFFILGIFYVIYFICVYFYNMEKIRKLKEDDINYIENLINSKEVGDINFKNKYNNKGINFIENFNSNLREKDLKI